VIGLALVFVWYRRNKKQQARNLPRTSASPAPETSYSKVATEAENGEAGFTPGVLPSRSPTASIPSHDTESHLLPDYQSVYVESTIPWFPGVEAENYSLPNPHPGPLPSPYAPPLAAPPPRDFLIVPTVQKETRYPGSHRDET